MDFGYSVIEQLLENGLISNIADLYTLKLEDVASLKKNGQKFASNLINAIEDSKTTALDAYISAFGISLIGKTAAKELTQHFETYKYTN